MKFFITIFNKFDFTKDVMASFIVSRDEFLAHMKSIWSSSQQLRHFDHNQKGPTSLTFMLYMR